MRAIRATMERSSRHPNFAGVSGIAGGLIAMVGLVTETRLNNSGWPFVLHWSIVILAAWAVDFALTAWRTRHEDKTVVRRLMGQLARAALPGLGAGLLLTVAFVVQGRASEVFPYWMLTYGVAMSAVAMVSTREVAWLARGFLACGALTLAFQIGGQPWVALPMFAASFGGIHIVYGIVVGQKEGW